jgi:hypothetical protein
MNERIKLLAAQASDDGDHIHYYNLAFAEKFADLIVQQCMQRLKTTGGEESFYSNKVMNYLDCIEDLKLHFGIEE